MSLAQKFSTRFAAGVRSRGARYFDAGRVEIVDTGSDFVTARVRGSQLYAVALRLEGDALLGASCTCPHYEGGAFCKHIWATMLAADEAGCFASLGPCRLAGIRKKESDQADDSDLSDEFDLAADPLEQGPWASILKAAEGPNGGLSKRLLDMLSLRRFRRKQAVRRAPPDWHGIVSLVRRTMESDASRSSCEVHRKKDWPDGRFLSYVADKPTVLQTGNLHVSVMYRRPKKNGGLTKPQVLGLYGAADIDAVPDPADRDLLLRLEGASSAYGVYYGRGTYQVASGAWNTILPLLCRTGRFHLGGQGGFGEWGPAMRLDDGPPWVFSLVVERDPRTDEYNVGGTLRRGDERMDLSRPDLLLAGGWLFERGTMSRLDDSGAFPWIAVLRKQPEFRVPVADGAKFLEKIFAAPARPAMVLPDELRVEEVRIEPRPALKIRRSKYDYPRDNRSADVSFDYGGKRVPLNDVSGGLFDPADRRVIVRDRDRERAAVERLFSLGFRTPSYYDSGGALDVRVDRLPKALPPLLREGWIIEAEGKLYRRAAGLSVEVRSGIDWFDLDGSADFDGVSVRLPQLLEALRKREDTVVLSDGSLGVIPEDWTKRWNLIAGLGKVEESGVRFGANQAALLDVLLAEQGEVRCDEVFERVRAELREFSGIGPAAPAGVFQGELRPYQSVGLGWLHFLRRFRFGGCLADDMGLGKTVQVLALLETRRAEHAAAHGGNGRRPSLVVVPRSLLFNWREEAARFTPGLRVREHAGSAREKNAAAFEGVDLVLTTYGTLRRDAAFLKDVPFDYVILDEAQAIKNAGTASAKATRLLQADHRLAMSGTPIENHIGELWSLFEFLNPGMLGAASVFQATARGGGLEDEERVRLSRALRPFILRRTKAQVATDLPARTEQTICCELDGDQRKQYEELREHYRQSLLGRVDHEGLAKSKMHVLEALLRLRQAACHPGLIDKARTAESSAKLEALLPELAEVTEEGHKALVFSQFTSMLAIVRSRLDASGTPYAYLDGRTRDRAACVARFMSDPGCKLFLISLKAGGLGLNLTAAEYVFLLDPWWNPAVEAQAIDRTHRIGQTSPVFAYRLIAKNTVEEKVLELQQTKRDLADAIINADNGLMRNLTREDLELLLG